MSFSSKCFLTFPLWSFSLSLRLLASVFLASIFLGLLAHVFRKALEWSLLSFRHDELLFVLPNPV